jgi:hypothetical protein
LTLPEDVPHPGTGDDLQSPATHPNLRRGCTSWPKRHGANHTSACVGASVCAGGLSKCWFLCTYPPLPSPLFPPALTTPLSPFYNELFSTLTFHSSCIWTNNALFMISQLCTWTTNLRRTVHQRLHVHHPQVCME